MNRKYIIEIIKSTGPLLIVIYCALGVVPIINYSYLNHEPFLFSFKYVGPVIMALLAYNYFKSISVQPLYISVMLFIPVVIKTFFLTIMTTGYILLLNEYLSEGYEVCYKGSLVEKWRNSESLLYTDYNFKIRSKKDNKLYSLNVSKMDFNKFQKSDSYQQCLNIGFFEIGYK